MIDYDLIGANISYHRTRNNFHEHVRVKLWDQANKTGVKLAMSLTGQMTDLFVLISSQMRWEVERRSRRGRRYKPLPPWGE